MMAMIELLAAAVAAPEYGGAQAATGVLGDYGWVLAANVVIWGGIGLYVLRIGSRLRRLEK